MNTLLKLLLVSTLIWLTPLTIILVTLTTQTPHIASNLKTQIKQANVYENLLTSLEDIIQERSDSESKEIEALVWPLIKAEVTPIYLQTKVETFIDDTHSWVTGTTSKPPVISFQDLKEVLVKKHKKQYDQLVKLSKQFNKEQAQLIKEAEADPQLAQELSSYQSIDLETFLTTDPVIPMQDHLQWLKDSFDVVKQGLPIIVTTDIVIALSIVLLSSSLPDKLRWLGIAGITISLSSGISYLLATVSLSTLLNLITQTTGSLAPLVQNLIPPLVSPLVAVYLTHAKITTLVIIIPALILLVLSFKSPLASKRTP